MTTPHRSLLATLAAITLASVTYQAGAHRWRDNAHYAARLAVSLCHTDTECQHAGAVADDYGAALPFAGRDSWTD